MKNKLFVIIFFSSIALSIEPASKWRGFFDQFKSPHWSTFNKARVTRFGGLDDEKNKEEKSATSLRQPIYRFQEIEKPKLFPKKEDVSWRERLNRWWNSWFYPEK